MVCVEIGNHSVLNSDPEGMIWVTLGLVRNSTGHKIISGPIVTRWENLFSSLITVCYSSSENQQNWVAVLIFVCFHLPISELVMIRLNFTVWVRSHNKVPLSSCNCQRPNNIFHSLAAVKSWLCTSETDSPI